MGAWLKVNEEAVYSSKPWTYQNDTTSGNVWYGFPISLVINEPITHCSWYSHFTQQFISTLEKSFKFYCLVQINEGFRG